MVCSFFKHIPKLIIFGTHNLQTFGHNMLINELLPMHFYFLSSLLNGAMLTSSVMRNFQNLHYFAVSALEDEKLTKKETCTKNEVCKLYSRVF